MSALREISEPDWQTSRTGISASREAGRKSSRWAVLIRVLLAVAAGVLISHSLTANPTLVAACTVVAVAVLFPILSGWFLKERLRAGGREEGPPRRGLSREFADGQTAAADSLPAGVLIVSADLRVRFANQAYLEAAFQNIEDVVGWRLDDVMPAGGLEERARALLARSYAATSCGFTSLPGRFAAEHRPVSITMTRIPPAEGGERILVVVEDLHFPAGRGPVIEGYIC